MDNQTHAVAGTGTVPEIWDRTIKRLGDDGVNALWRRVDADNVPGLYKSVYPHKWRVPTYIVDVAHAAIWMILPLIMYLSTRTDSLWAVWTAATFVLQKVLLRAAVVGVCTYAVDCT